MSDPIGAVHSNAASSSLMFQSVPVALKHLYLDPNNYRFIDASEYTKVERKNLFDDKIQKRTTSFILGDKQENVSGGLHVVQGSKRVQKDAPKRPRPPTSPMPIKLMSTTN